MKPLRLTQNGTPESLVATACKEFDDIDLPVGVTAARPTNQVVHDRPIFSDAQWPDKIAGKLPHGASERNGRAHAPTMLAILQRDRATVPCCAPFRNRQPQP